MPIDERAPFGDGQRRGKNRATSSSRHCCSALTHERAARRQRRRSGMRRTSLTAAASEHVARGAHFVAAGGQHSDPCRRSGRRRGRLDRPRGHGHPTSIRKSPVTTCSGSHGTRRVTAPATIRVDAPHAAQCWLLRVGVRRGNARNPRLPRTAMHDWRNSALFFFDLAMVLRGLASATRLRAHRSRSETRRAHLRASLQAGSGRRHVRRMQSPPRSIASFPTGGRRAAGAFLSKAAGGVLIAAAQFSVAAAAAARAPQTRRSRPRSSRCRVSRTARRTRCSTVSRVR